MTFRSALTNLAALSVSGVTHNYDVDAVLDDLSRAQLPALLVMPVELDAAAVKQPGEGFQAVAFSSGPRTVTYSLTHLLLVAPAEAGRGLRSNLPTLVNLMDAYFTALGADVTLGDTLLEPAQVRVEPRLVKFGHATYVGCSFRHTWQIQV